MKALSIALVLLLAAPAIASAGDFPPWNADVAVGDEIPAGKAIPHRPRPRTIYNGPQVGAWALIRLFQVVISPQDGPNCRFQPTCSRYASEAVERYGALPGAFMAGDRLIRCNPFNPPGKDPVPPALK